MVNLIFIVSKLQANDNLHEYLENAIKSSFPLPLPNYSQSALEGMSDNENMDSPLVPAQS